MNEGDLIGLINKVLDDELKNKTLPKVCGIASDSYGHFKLVNRVKEMILMEGMTNVLSCLAQIEDEID